MSLEQGLSLTYIESLDDGSFDNFAEKVELEGIPVTLKRRPEPGPYACVEWFLPTAIMAGISSGLLNEAGKDLYQALKRHLVDLTTKTMKKPRIEPTLYGRGAETESDNPYSLGFSIYSEAGLRRKFKLLIPKHSEDNDYEKIVCAFTDFLREYNNNNITEADLLGLDESIVILPSTILVHYNESTGSIEWVDHLPASVREKFNKAMLQAKRSDRDGR